VGIGEIFELYEAFYFQGGWLHFSIWLCYVISINFFMKITIIDMGSYNTYCKIMFQKIENWPFGI
jgi:hypothetical protein